MTDIEKLQNALVFHDFAARYMLDAVAELFDAVDGLGVEIENLQAENAKTFEVGKRWMAKAARFEAENSKLRELLASIISNYVDGYMDGTSARYPCDLCDESSMQQCDYQHDGQCPFYSQLRKLGIEVDG